MPDEEAMYAPERLIRAGLFFAVGPKAIRGTWKGLGKVGEFSGSKLNAWRAAGKFSEQASKWKKAGWVLQRGALFTAWTGDTIWATATVRPIRKPIWNWITKGIESSPILSKGNRASGLFQKGLAYTVGAYVFDDYSTPINSEFYGPHLDTTARARIYTLDPLPPKGQETK
jgi:hypothetical protein